jgi:hypothetical protein
MNAKKLKIYLKKVIYKTGYKFSRTRNFIFSESILNKLLVSNGEIFFVQIGGNDGINDDP